MKAAIVTFVRAYNYGAVLQCYALSRKLLELGVDVEVLDYYPQYFNNQYNMSYLGKIRLFPNRHIRSWMKFFPVKLLLNRRNRGFEHFIERYIPLTERQYTSSDEIAGAKLPFDIYISGSDQVWSSTCIPFDPIYYLTFPSAEGRKKCSYAASFGGTSIPKELEADYKQRLSGWDAYSVREQSGVEILRKLLNVEASQCCDPTLLLTKKEWDSIADTVRMRKPYILIYSVNGCNELLKYGETLAHSTGFRVVYLPCIMRHEKLMGYDAKKYKFRTFGGASPNEWLGLFAKAEYILTDSFHGTIFSILNHKKFMTMTEFSWGKNSRAQELMTELRIEGRELSGDVQAINKELDWEKIDKQLESVRKESTAYLCNLVDGWRY